MLLPVWIPGSYGTLKINGRTAHINVTPGDLVDLLTSGNAFEGEGYFEFRYDRFFTFAGALGGYVDESASETVPTKQFPNLSGIRIDATAKLKEVVGDFAVGYRLGQWWLPNRHRPLTLGVYTGARYYRALAFDRESSSSSELDLEFRGPYGGAGFVF